MRTLWWIAVLASCDAVQDRPAPSWSYIHAAIIAPSCATSSCHSRISSVAGMDLSTPTSAYALLTGRTCDAPEVGGEQSIVEDRFVNALEGDAERPSTGEYDLLMPPDQRLTDAEIELVRAWVRAGALCD